VNVSSYSLSRALSSAGAGLLSVIDSCSKLHSLNLTSCRSIRVTDRRRFFEVRAVRERLVLLPMQITHLGVGARKRGLMSPPSLLAGLPQSKYYHIYTRGLIHHNEKGCAGAGMLNKSR
jgi:hypothetical protein